MENPWPDRPSPVVWYQTQCYAWRRDRPYRVDTYSYCTSSGFFPRQKVSGASLRWPLGKSARKPLKTPNKVVSPWPEFQHCLKTGFFKPAQLECLYLDKTAVCPKTTHAVAALGPLLAHPQLLSSKSQRGCDLSLPPVVFVLCMVPYLDLFNPFRFQQLIN